MEANQPAGTIAQVHFGRRAIHTAPVWVSEVWESLASHDASLSLPSVRNAIPQAKAIVSSLDKIAFTSPIWGVGLEPAYVHCAADKHSYTGI